MWSRVAVLVSLGLLSIGTSLASSRPGAHDRTVHTVPVGPDSQVRVHATVGHITVIGWDRNQLHVEIERHAPSAEDLARLDASASVSRNGREVTISAAQRGGAGRGGQAPPAGRARQDRGTGEAASMNDASLESTLTIHAPLRTNFAAIDLFEGGVTLSGLHGPVKATVTRGGITGDRLAGPLRLETIIGDIRLTLAKAPPQPIHLRAFNGNLSLRLPATPRDARILALSLGGQIASTVPLDAKTGFGPKHGSATFGSGEPVVALDTVNGDIAILTNSTPAADSARRD